MTKDERLKGVKRGAIKAFKEYLNENCNLYSNRRLVNGGGAWKNGIYGNRKAQYGDYLYKNDRDLFICSLKAALNNDSSFEGFNSKGWTK